MFSCDKSTNLSLENADELFTIKANVEINELKGYLTVVVLPRYEHSFYNTSLKIDVSYETPQGVKHNYCDITIHKDGSGAMPKKEVEIGTLTSISEEKIMINIIEIKGYYR